MAFKYSIDSIDSNHNEIVDTFRSMGCVVTSTTCVKGFCDMVVAWKGLYLLIEVKDGAKPPSKRKLTPMEAAYHIKVEGVGCKVYIIKNKEEAINLIKSI